MAGYLGYFVDWMANVASAVGDWFTQALWKLTHEPLWGGVAIALFLVLVLLAYLKRRAAG